MDKKDGVVSEKRGLEPPRTRPPSLPALRVVLVSLVAVVATMAAMFTVPSQNFITVAYVSTGTMAVAGYLLMRHAGLFRPRAKTLAFGLFTAAILYVIFFAGNSGVNALHPFGMTSSSESSIYSLIASPSNPLYLQVGILAFDAVGYELFFRGALQTTLRPRVGIASVFLVALADALVHVISLNPLWVATTFIADSVWGLTYFYSKDLSSSMTSHFVWDVVIFIVFPIR